MRQVAVVVLIDARGRILLQERDEHAPVAPDVWSFVGGTVEDGERPEAAAYRELAEETGLVLRSGLTMWRRAEINLPERGETVSYSVWLGRSDASDADIVVGEGRDIRFVDRTELGELPLGGIAPVLLDDLLASTEYRALSP